MIEYLTGMKRTLLAIGIAVLVSMMVAPFFCDNCGTDSPAILRATAGGSWGIVWIPFFLGLNLRFAWTAFTLQTLFLAVLFAVLVNLFPRRPRR